MVDESTDGSSVPGRRKFARRDDGLMDESSSEVLSGMGMASTWARGR